MFHPSRRVRASLLVLWAATILVGSLVQGGGGTLPPTGPFGLVGADKWVHAVEYGCLAVLAAWTTLPRTRRAVLRILVVVAAYGAVVELLQVPLATRSGDPADAVANAVGAVVAVTVWYGSGLSVRLATDGDGDTE